MSVPVEPRSGLSYGDTLGAQAWNIWMDANLLRIGRFAFHLSVKDQTTTTPPSSPTAGDTYVVGTGGSGAWAGKDTNVAVWDGTAWQFGVPRTGWVLFDESSNKLCAFYSGAWSAGVSL